MGKKSKIIFIISIIGLLGLFDINSDAIIKSPFYFTNNTYDLFPELSNPDSLVQAGTDLKFGLGYGRNRVVFQNLRGYEYYYSFYVDDSDDLILEYSTDSTIWSNSPQTVYTGTVSDFDMKIYDSGTDLKIFLVLYDSVANDLTYIRGSLGDTDTTPTWDTPQDVDAGIEEQIDDQHWVSITHTESNELVITYTEDDKIGGKNYRYTKMVGSDGDGAAPSWATPFILDDPTIYNPAFVNQDKPYKWSGMESFSSNFPDRFVVYARLANALTTETYKINIFAYDWDGGTSTFTLNSSSSLGSDSIYINASSVIIADDDRVHWLNVRPDAGEYLVHKPFKYIGTVTTGGYAFVLTTADIDALTLTYNSYNDTIFVFYKHTADTTTLHYQYALNVHVQENPWSGQRSITTTDTVAHLSSWNKEIKGSFHLSYSDDDGDIYYETMYQYDSDMEENAPTWDTLIESDDPLELGDNETISINVYDESIISDVYLEFRGSNHSMGFVSGDTYSYSLWQPDSIGLKNYSIWMIDEYNNINWSGIYNITVEDTSPPIIFNINESSDPLELGSNETITCNITDYSCQFPIFPDFVYLEFGGSNHSMENTIIHITPNGTIYEYEYSLWLPTSTGLKNYTIWASDIYANIGSYSNNITVQDTVPPLIFDILESDDPLELGNNETITCNITDYSIIIFVYLEFEGSNHSMSNIYGNTYQYSLWQPPSIGLYNYTIWTSDNETNINFYSDNITVVGVPTPPTWDTLIIFYNPLTVRNRQIIWINVYDTDISDVYIEYDGSNHSMRLIYNDTYTFTRWRPRTLGIHEFTIWMIDNEGSINSTSDSFEVINTSEVIASVIVIGFLSSGMIFFYLKSKIFLVMLSILLFSLIIGFLTIQVPYFPFTPWFQTFFMVFQTSLFSLTVIKERRF